MKAVRWPPRFEPAKSHDFLPRGYASKRPFRRVVRQADVAIVEEGREGGPCLEHVIHGLGHIVVL
ncbi:hypothetical protein [Sphingobium xenophagum]|nr:hypothetical protein [Sphingobium xenophagum]